MIIKIDNIDVSNVVTAFSVTFAGRNESVNNNLLGDMTVDRTKQKFSLSISFGRISTTRWREIYAVLNKIFFTATFYDAVQGEITRAFHCSGITSPVAQIISTTTYYSDISITLEEQ